MQRREFLIAGFGAALAARRQTAPIGTVQKLKLDINSKHLQWLRTGDEVAEAVVEMGFDGVNVSVAEYPAHVSPGKVVSDLPVFVNAIRKRGLQVVSITTSITDADSPYAEDILKTASTLGIAHYSCGPFRNDQAKPILPQLDALKPRLASLAALNAKHRITGSHAGSTLWDILYVLKDVDPARLGIHYDVFNQVQDGGWELNLRAASRHITAVTLKDFTYEQNLGLKGEGGPYTPPPPGSAPAGSGPGGGRGRGGPGGPGGAGRGGAGGAGRSAAPPPPPKPGLPNGWKIRQAPLGMGMVNLPYLGAVLKEIGFSGPIEIQIEYENGGAETGQDKITLPRAHVLGVIKRDLLAVRRAFSASGLI